MEPLRSHLCWIKTCPNAEFLVLAEPLSSQRIGLIGSVYFLLLVKICAPVLGARLFNLSSIDLLGLGLSLCESNGLLMLCRRENSIWILIRAYYDVWIFDYKVVTGAHIELQGWRLYIVTMHFSKSLVFHSDTIKLKWWGDAYVSVFSCAWPYKFGCWSIYCYMF